MRGIVFLFGLILVPALAQADFFRCSFDGGRYRAEFETEGSRLDIYQGPRALVSEEVSFQVLGPGNFEVWSMNRRPIVRLLLNNLGSDGRSLETYPYQAELRLPGARPILGGCYSNYIPMPGKSPTPPRAKPKPAPHPRPVEPEPEIPLPPEAPSPPPSAPYDPNAPKPGRVTPIED
jgi:hypothetical protein